MSDVAQTLKETLREAIAHHQARRWSEAERLYRVVLTAQPSHADANHNLGVLAFQLGRPEAALSHLKLALEASPENGRYRMSYIEALAGTGRLPDAQVALDAGARQGLAGPAFDALRAQIDAQRRQLSQAGTPPAATSDLIAQAVQHHNAGRLAEAEELYHRILAVDPRHIDSLHLLGVVARAQGRHDLAAEMISKAIALNDGVASFHANLALVHHDQGKLDQAVVHYERALVLKPDYADALANLGSALQEQGKLDEAIVKYEQALAITPDFPEALANLGVALQAQGRLDEAVARYEQALAVKPDFPEALSNLGNALKERGRLTEAVSRYEQALAIQPNFPKALYNLGNALQEQGKCDQAIARFEQALAYKPDYAEALANLGNALKDQGRVEEAIVRFERALAIDPDFAPAISNLASAYQEQGKLTAAVACYDRALALDPNLANAHCNLAGLLLLFYRHHEASVHARRAVLLAPRLAQAHQTVSIVLAYQSDYSEVVEHSNTAMSLDADDNPSWESRLYTYSYHPDLSAEEIYAEFVRWGDRFPAQTAASHTNDPQPSRRLRIGYVSPDFRRHTSRFFFEPLFSHHDRSQVEIFAYSNVKYRDDYTTRFEELFDHWRDIRAVPDEEVDALIRRDGIDILVDACGHMMDERLGVFARKPAPIQVTWLGSGWTSGLPMMDYVLFDAHVAPDGTLAREEIVRLPGCFMSYRPPDVASEVAPLPMVKNGYVTFGYSGRTERLNHRVFRAWGEILRRLPNARLILDYPAFADPPTQNHYKDFLTRHGIDVVRVTMRRSLNIFEGLGDIDILLDFFPHSGGTMLFDALWMGLPALTLASRPPVGRIGTTLMTNLGLESWVAQSEGEYIDKAIDYAHDVEEMKTLRATMRARMRASPLMDETGFTRSVESAYRAMWQRWCNESQSR